MLASLNLFSDFSVSFTALWEWIGTRPPISKLHYNQFFLHSLAYAFLLSFSEPSFKSSMPTLKSGERQLIVPSIQCIFCRPLLSTAPKGSLTIYYFLGSIPSRQNSNKLIKMNANTTKYCWVSKDRCLVVACIVWPFSRYFNVTRETRGNSMLLLVHLLIAINDYGNSFFSFFPLNHSHLAAIILC